ncbi:family 43 glycosylhydrolase [Maribellus sediminis]|uniref:family 43 glycosylhydrolase n=1 Tax=Maribellus sediminis TaxID=2696285 RepID=UPI001431FE4A|nr:family 43 glycosylhydrolase [Maribellus sediminis]
MKRLSVIKTAFLAVILLLAACRLPVVQGKKEYIKNPVLPGWFADPTIKKFGDIYYIYATTDNEMLASGAPTVWYSRDLQNWYNYIMEVPSLNSVNLRNFWAPDILEGDDGRYYLYFGNCQAGCNIYGYVSDSPLGPWEKLHDDDTPVIANGYPIQNFPSLDAQFFRDDDGTIYGYWGTWVHYNHGYAVGVLNNETMDEVSDGTNIPLEQTPNPFEAAYPMKKGEKYILMYSAESCHNESYKVLYSYADSPFGPFNPGENNPILQTNEEGSTHGPGHHSVLQNGNDYYIVYHKHDYPFTAGGMARQVCIDSMIFENDSTIKAIVPTTRGIEAFVKSEVPENIAYQAGASASSFYHLNSPDYDYEYSPANAFDNDNATIWKAADNTFPQSLTVDLGEEKNVERVAIQFEFATYYYQYKVEYSNDNENWEVFADRSDNRTPGSPMIDDNSVKARYLKLTVLGTEQTGVLAAVWNMKVYSSAFELPIQIKNKASENEPGAASSKSLLAGFEINEQSSLKSLANTGILGDNFTVNGDLELVTDNETGERAIDFRNGFLQLDGVEVPRSLEWNGSFSVVARVKNPVIGNEGECLASWCNRRELYLANTFNAPFYNKSNYGAMAHLDGHFDMPFNNLPEANKWHTIVVTFDGVVEKVYVDGKLDNSQNMLLSSQIKGAKITIGASDVGEYYTGLMSRFAVYDYALSEKEIGEF